MMQKPYSVTGEQILMKVRKIAVEPSFSLDKRSFRIAKQSQTASHKRPKNVCTLLALGCLIVQFVMISNSVWGFPIWEISHLIATFG